MANKKVINEDLRRVHTTFTLKKSLIEKIKEIKKTKKGISFSSVVSDFLEEYVNKNNE